MFAPTNELGVRRRAKTVSDFPDLFLRTTNTYAPFPSSPDGYFSNPIRVSVVKWRSYVKAATNLQSLLFLTRARRIAFDVTDTARSFVTYDRTCTYAVHIRSSPNGTLFREVRRYARRFRLGFPGRILISGYLTPNVYCTEISFAIIFAATYERNDTIFRNERIDVRRVIAVHKSSTDVFVFVRPLMFFGSILFDDRRTSVYVSFSLFSDTRSGRIKRRNNEPLGAVPTSLR